MSDFDTCLGHVLRWEGSYSNDPRDPGGETKFGISKKAYPNEDIANLTKERAAQIYRRDYWDALGCGKLSPGLALLVFNAGVNAGVKRADGWLLKSNGDMQKFAVSQAVHYALLDHLDDTYARGWFNRLFDIYTIAVQMKGD